jgi:hypothetical protein
MTQSRWCLALCFALSVTLGAQAARTFSARLSTVPVEASTLARLTGSGKVTAVLTGQQLTVTGTFTGLQSPATAARLHVAPKGLRGPAMADLVVTKETSGTISGSLTLTPVQADHFARNRVYVQIHSEKAPEGNLWGWLLP